MARVIAGLGIRHIGGQAAQILAEHFGSYPAFMKAALEDETKLAAIDQIGPVMAKSIREYFHKQSKHLEDLMQYLNPQQFKAKRTNKLADKTIVITGTLENYGRKEIEKVIKDNGGKISSSVSGKTDFVLAGADPGSKLDKAQQFGIKVINENQFLKMIGKDVK